MLAVAEIPFSRGRDSCLLVAQDDLGGEPLAFAMGQPSIYCHTVAHGGLAADPDSQAMGNFHSQSPVQYRAMNRLYNPHRFDRTPKRSERGPKHEPRGSCRQSLYELPSTD